MERRVSGVLELGFVRSLRCRDFGFRASGLGFIGS